MKTLITGIAEYMKHEGPHHGDRARKAQASEGRADSLVHLSGEFCEGTFPAQQGTADADRAGETLLAHRTGNSCGTKKIQSVAHSEDDGPVRPGGIEGRRARKIDPASYLRSGASGRFVDVGTCSRWRHESEAGGFSAITDKESVATSNGVAYIQEVLPSCWAACLNDLPSNRHRGTAGLVLDQLAPDLIRVRVPGRASSGADAQLSFLPRRHNPKSY